MTKSRLAVALASIAVAASPLAFAQGAQRGTASVVVGSRVSVDFGTPSLKGRAVADLLKLLPAERIWRTGGNEVSTLATEGDILVGGTLLPSGKYSLYTHVPESGPWSLILNSDLGQPLGQLWKEAPEAIKNAPYPYIGNYEERIKAKEVLRVPLSKGRAEPPVEVFRIDLLPKGAGATIVLSWGDETWSAELTPAKK